MRAALADRNKLSHDFRDSVSGVGAMTPEDQLAVKLDVFLDLAAGLKLDLAEERTMLDVSMRDLHRLRHNTSLAISDGGTKLQRRLDYAIPVLRRMLASAAS